MKAILNRFLVFIVFVLSCFFVNKIQVFATGANDSGLKFEIRESGDYEYYIECDDVNIGVSCKDENFSINEFGRLENLKKLLLEGNVRDFVKALNIKKFKIESDASTGLYATNFYLSYIDNIKNDDLKQCGVCKEDYIEAKKILFEVLRKLIYLGLVDYSHLNETEKIKFKTDLNKAIEAMKITSDLISNIEEFFYCLKNREEFINNESNHSLYELTYDDVLKRYDKELDECKKRIEKLNDSFKKFLNKVKGC